MLGAPLPPLPPMPSRFQYQSSDEFDRALQAHRAAEHRRKLKQADFEASHIVFVAVLACLGVGGVVALLFASGGTTLVATFVGGLCVAGALAVFAQRCVKARIIHKRGLDTAN